MNKNAIYKIVPCPWYDIEKIENWLETMAEKGYFLRKEVYFGIFTSFSREKVGKRVRYRLEASPNGAGLFSTSGGEPEPEAKELAAEMGWEYQTRCGQFFIYRCDDPDAPELNTDPAVQVLALDRLRKREWAGAFTLFFWLAVYPLALAALGGPLLAVLETGTFFWVLVAVLVLSEAVEQLHKLLLLRRLRRRLAAGEPLTREEKSEPQVGGRAQEWVYPIWSIAGLLLAVWVVVLAVGGWMRELDDADAVPIAGYAETLPFRTLHELAEPGTFEEENIVSGSNTVTIRSDWLAGTIVSGNEHGSLMLSDGRTVSGFIYYDYAELRSETLAEELAREYEAEARRSARKEGEAFAPIEIPNAGTLGIDWALGYAAYPYGAGGSTVILVDERRVLRVSFYQYADAMAMEEWVGIFASDLQK